MHSPNPNYQRAARLFETSRFDQAERELRMALADDPGDADAHALLAMCLVEQQKYQPATEEGQLAVHLAPDSPLSHYALARVHEECNRLPEAAAAMEESLRLNPYDASSYSLLAAIRYRQERWQDALTAADAGIQIEPEHNGCTNLRAMALVKLGRKDEARDVLSGVLARDPENAYSQANQGWAYLEKGQPKQALEHFTQALRINPTLPHARGGMVEALKSRYFIYRWMLAYFLWMAKLSGQARWGILIGGYIGYQVMLSVSRSNEALAPWLQPLIILYIVFAVMTWVSSPLMNLVLRLNRFGRYLLSREQIITSNFVGLCVVVAVTGLIAHFGFAAPWGLWMALVGGLTIPAVSAVYLCDEGWPRTSMLLIALAVVLLGVTSIAVDFAIPLLDDPEALGVALLQMIGGLSSLGFVIAALGSQFAANYFSSVTVRH